MGGAPFRQGGGRRTSSHGDPRGAVGGFWYFPLVKLRWRAPLPGDPALEKLPVGPTETGPRGLRGRGGAGPPPSFLWIQAAGFLFYLVVSTWAVPGQWVRFGVQSAFGWVVILLLAWAVRRGRVVLA